MLVYIKLSREKSELYNLYETFSRKKWLGATPVQSTFKQAPLYWACNPLLSIVHSDKI
jgi:hypothetical protein